MKALFYCVVALSATAALATDTVMVYQLSGERQCIESAGVPVDQAADLLRAQGVRVIAAERRELPLKIPARCGAPTAIANVFTIPAADWAAFTAKIPDAGGYGLWIFEEPQVDVFRYDGLLQCGLGEEISLQKMSDRLAARGIEVLDRRKGDDGLQHVAVCGASAGSINIFTIARRDLDAARELGFELLVSRETAARVKRPLKPLSETEAAAEAPSPRLPIPQLW